MDSPEAFLIIQEVLSILQNEKQKRQGFYDEISEQQKVEFINGEVIIHSPLIKKHNQVCGLLYQLLHVFVHKHQLGFVGIEKIMIALSRNDYEPDLCFFNQEKAQNFQENQSLFPAPDLIVEILSSSTEARGRGIKFHDYAAHEVSEYWIIDPQSEFVEQYILQNKSYELQIKSKDGHIVSRAVKGFEIPIVSIFSDVENYKVLLEMMK